MSKFILNRTCSLSKMTCVTCHDPDGENGQPKLLRINLSELCLKSHFSGAVNVA